MNSIKSDGSPYLRKGSVLGISRTGHIYHFGSFTELFNRPVVVVVAVAVVVVVTCCCEEALLRLDPLIPGE